MIQRVKTGVIADGAITTAKMNDEVENLFSFRNRIINGAMEIDQRNLGAQNTSALQVATFTADRWHYYNDVVSKRRIQISTDVPTGSGFKNSLLVTVISTDTSGPQQFLAQTIEGNNIVDFAWGTASAKAATLSFWVKSSVTGQHGGSLQNFNTTRSYPFSYTINVANTWEYKTVAISGETTGSWATDNTMGVRVLFEHGPGYQKTAAGAWTASNTSTHTNAINLCATNGATWYITGIQLELGSTATPFERRPYGTELQLCQRYYENGPTTVVTWLQSSTAGKFNGTYQVPKRTNASISTVSGSYLAQWPGNTFPSGFNSSLGTVTFSLFNGGSNTNGFVCDFSFTSSFAGGTGFVFMWNNAFLPFWAASAEL